MIKDIYGYVRKTYECGSLKIRYTNLAQDLENDFLVGVDNYPDNLTER